MENLRLRKVKQIVQFHRTSSSGSWTYILKYMKIFEAIFAYVKVCTPIWDFIWLNKKRDKIKEVNFSIFNELKFFMLNLKQTM